MRASLLLVSMCFCPAVFSQAPAHWTCVDAAGKTVATDAPCPAGSTKIPARLAVAEPKPDWRSQGIPVWVWAIVGVLGLIWLRVLLPENLFGGKAAEPPPKLPPAPLVPPHASRRPPAVTPAPPGPLTAWTPELINGLTLNRLETLVQRFWQARGCEVQRAHGADGGIEFLISRPGIGKLFALAQCAPTRGDKIGLATVQALTAVGAQKAAGIVVLYSLPGFTDEALAFAQGKPLKLIGPPALLADIGLLPPMQQQRLLEQTLLASGPALARA